MSENANDFVQEESSWWSRNWLWLALIALLLLCCGPLAFFNWDFISGGLGLDDIISIGGDNILEDGYAIAGEDDTYFVRKFATDRGFSIAHMMFPDTGNGTISELGDIPNLGEGAQFFVMLECDAEDGDDCDPWGYDVYPCGSLISSYSSEDHGDLSFGNKRGMVLFFPDQDAAQFCDQWAAERANPQIFGPTP